MWQRGTVLVAAVVPAGAAVVPWLAAAATPSAVASSTAPVTAVSIVRRRSDGNGAQARLSAGQ